MRSKWWNWSGVLPVLVALLLLATGADMGRAAAAQGNTDAPKPLSEKIVTTWKKAGADVGWLRAYQNGYSGIVWEQVGKPGDVPAFRFSVWQAGRLAKLPAPATAFGLKLGGTLGGSQVTDAGLKELVGFQSLHTLSLGNTKVTDAGLKELARLRILHTLVLSFTQVTDAGLKALASLKNLQTLHLRETQVTGVGLKELANLKCLHTLNLRDCPLTDAGLKELAGLKSLQYLDLFNTPVTDAGLKALASLKHLHTLRLHRTQVTDAGVQELGKALPRCKIYK